MPEISSSSRFHNIIRSSEIELPADPVRPPSWDLEVVLGALCSEEYEPMADLSSQVFTKNIHLLVALATAERMSELHAMSSQASFQRNDIVLRYLPELRAKTETASNPLPRHLVIKTL